MKTLAEYLVEERAAHARLPALYGGIADEAARRRWLADWYNEQVTAIIGRCTDQAQARKLYEAHVSPDLLMGDRLRQFMAILVGSGLATWRGLAGISVDPPKE